MMNRDAAYLMLDRILSWAGNYDMQVLIRGVENGLTRFADSEIHQNIFQEDLEVTIELRKGKKRSEVTTNKLAEEELKSAIREAQTELKQSSERELELPMIAAPEEISSSEFDEKLTDELSSFGRAEKIKNGVEDIPGGFSGAGSLALERGYLALGNTEGIRRYARQDSGKFNTVISSQEGDGSGYAELESETLQDFDIEKGFARAIEKAENSTDPESLSPGEYTVILEPLAVAELLGYLAYIGFSGRSVQQGRSFLTGKIGEKVWGDNISIYDDCQHEKTITLPFDMEGAERQNLTIIKEGVARDLTYDLESAMEAGVETTGHALGSSRVGSIPLHLVMSEGESSPEEMISKTEKGLVITRFHYTNVVNPRQAILTGLTRDGTFLIEEGEITTSVKDLRYTQDMMEALNNVISLSSQRFKVPGLAGNYYLPYLKIADFKFTGVTEE